MQVAKEICSRMFLGFRSSGFGSLSMCKAFRVDQFRVEGVTVFKLRSGGFG